MNAEREREMYRKMANNGLTRLPFHRPSPRSDQMDIKVEGITVDIMRDALAKAEEARATS